MNTMIENPLLFWLNKTLPISLLAFNDHFVHHSPSSTLSSSSSSSSEELKQDKDVDPSSSSKNIVDHCDHDDDKGLSESIALSQIDGDTPCHHDGDGDGDDDDNGINGGQDCRAENHDNNVNIDDHDHGDSGTTTIATTPPSQIPQVVNSKSSISSLSSLISKSIIAPSGEQSLSTRLPSSSWSSSSSSTVQANSSIRSSPFESEGNKEMKMQLKSNASSYLNGGSHGNDSPIIALIHHGDVNNNHDLQGKILEDEDRLQKVLINLNVPSNTTNNNHSSPSKPCDMLEATEVASTMIPALDAQISGQQRFKSSKIIDTIIGVIRAEGNDKLFDSYTFGREHTIKINSFVTLTMSECTIAGLSNVCKSNNDAILRRLSPVHHSLDCIVTLNDLSCKAVYSIKLGGRRLRSRQLCLRNKTFHFSLAKCLVYVQMVFNTESKSLHFEHFSPISQSNFGCRTQSFRNHWMNRGFSKMIQSYMRKNFALNIVRVEGHLIRRLNKSEVLNYENVVRGTPLEQVFSAVSSTVAASATGTPTEKR